MGEVRLPALRPRSAPRPRSALRPRSAPCSRADRVALLRFVVAGSAGNVVYSVVFLAVARFGLGVTGLSVVASVVSTVAVNEAHRLWTFRGIGRPSLAQAHLSGLASLVAGTALTASVLTAWEALSPEAPLTTHVALSWAVTGLVGAANYLHLRGVALRPE